MPVYTYRCPKCGMSAEELRKIDARHDPFTCPNCEGDTLLEITPVAFDNLGMGLDAGFPTAFDRWGKLQSSKNSGKSWDSNNNRYGGDWEKNK